jgi:hypothetical protein
MKTPPGNVTNFYHNGTKTRGHIFFQLVGTIDPAAFERFSNDLSVSLTNFFISTVILILVFQLGRAYRSVRRSSCFRFIA